MHEEAQKRFNVILRELPQPLHRCSWCNKMCISNTNTVHLLQETPIPMDNPNITQKLKGHELAVDFIGAAFQFRKAGGRLAPDMHNLHHRKQNRPHRSVGVHIPQFEGSHQSEGVRIPNSRDHTEAWESVSPT